MTTKNDPESQRVELPEDKGFRTFVFGEHEFITDIEELWQEIITTCPLPEGDDVGDPKKQKQWYESVLTFCKSEIFPKYFKGFTPSRSIVAAWYDQFQKARAELLDFFCPEVNSPTGSK